LCLLVAGRAGNVLLTSAKYETAKTNNDSDGDKREVSLSNFDSEISGFAMNAGFLCVSWDSGGTMRSNILFYYFALYVAQNITLKETTQLAFMDWLVKTGYDEFKSDIQYIHRLFQNLCRVGLLVKTPHRTEERYFIYEIQRPELYESPDAGTEADMLLRIIFVSMMEGMDYQLMPLDERNLLRRSLTEPRGLEGGRQVLDLSELIQWPVHPATSLPGHHVQHLSVFAAAQKTSNQAGLPGIGLCEVGVFTSVGVATSWFVYPLQVQVRGDRVLLYAMVGDTRNVVWIPLQCIDSVRRAAGRPVFLYSAPEYLDATGFSQFLYPEVFVSYSLVEMMDSQTIELQFDEHGWEQLHSGQLPLDYEVNPQELVLEFSHPLTDSLVRWVMQFGRHVRILGPSPLRDRVRDEVALMVA
jgi:hypothetical protein